MSSYYTNTLYPLQDQVLRLLNTADTSFYLTGGTALGRCYFDHRYSDDLDFFVNGESSARFGEMVTDVLQLLRSHMNVEVVVERDAFVSIQIEKMLKVDFVNDSGKYFGHIEKKALFSRVDNLSNILANKVTALLGRDEPKDVADIFFITTHTKIDWRSIFGAVDAKAVGIFPPTMIERLQSFPLEMFDVLHWIGQQQPSAQHYREWLTEVTRDVLELG